MAKQQSINHYMRIFHRYLGFFLAGIMAVYSISGIVLVFRSTDFLKKEVRIEKTIATNLPADKIGKALKVKGFKIEKKEGDIYHFKQGTYDSQTGVAKYTLKKLPFLLDKMTHLHKATTNDPLYLLNILFGVSLLFFVISSFWMFLPSTKVFRKGLYFTLAGILLTLLMLFL